MSARHATTAVIGGGLHGLACALALAERGQDVAVLERSWIGRYASSATAAGVRTLWRHPAEIELSLAALARWHRIGDLVGDDCGFRPTGQIKIAETADELTVLAERAETTRRLGFAHEELVGAAELRELVPLLSLHCLGALIARRDGAADPHRAIAAFRRAALSAGASLNENTRVKGLEASNGSWIVHTDAGDWKVANIVNAAGAWAGQVCDMVGEPIRFGYKASMVFVTERVAPSLGPVVSAVGHTLSFKQSSQGTLVIGGGIQGSADLASGATQVDFRRLAHGARAVCVLFPSLDDVGIVRAWTGLEGRTPDLLPVIGRSARAPGVFHLFGFSGHGFELVPLAGDIVAGLIVSGQSEHDIRAFDIARLLS